MIKSMTGYGKSEYEQEGRKFSVEIKSINHRFQEINIRLPKPLNVLEEMVRSQIRNTVHRGKVDVFISFTQSSGDVIEIKIDDGIAKQYIQQLKHLQKEYSLIDDISVSLVANYPEIFKTLKVEEDLQILWEILSKPLEEALFNLVSMREKEGLALKINILDKIASIEKNVNAIAQRIPDLAVEYKQKLEKRLNELLQDQNIDEVRLAMEVAILVDRFSTDEEIVRLQSHLSQMKSVLNASEPIGRKLDFIIQEMNREINTIGSKANDLFVISLVVEVKSDIEKIREQIQNIE